MSLSFSCIIAAGVFMAGIFTPAGVPGVFTSPPSSSSIEGISAAPMILCRWSCES